MKKTVILLVLLLVFGGVTRVMAEETTYFRFKVKTYNDLAGKLFEKKARLSYSGSIISSPLVGPPAPEKLKGRVGFDFGKTAYYFAPEQKDRLIEAIDKYFEWVKLAIDKDVMVDKDIAKVAPRVYWTLGNKVYKSVLNDGVGSMMGMFPPVWADILTVGFFSQNKKRHQLTISCPEVKAIYSTGSYGVIYTEHDPETIYLEYAQVKALRANLTDEGIKAALAKIEKEKEAIDADFN